MGQEQERAQEALSAFVKGPRRVQEILTAIDALAQPGAVSGARAAMLDAFVELELLRGLVQGLAIALPSCARCGEHLAAYVEKERIDETDSHRCLACFEDLSPDGRDDYQPLPWGALTGQIEALAQAWRLQQVPSADPASVVQKAFAFR